MHVSIPLVGDMHGAAWHSNIPLGSLRPSYFAHFKDMCPPIDIIITDLDLMTLPILYSEYN